MKFLNISWNVHERDLLFILSLNSIQSYINLSIFCLLQQHLNDKEYQVLRLSYGLDCDKHSATEIADKIGIEGSSSYVRVSQLKKQAVDKLIENVDHSQVLDYL